MKLTMCTDHCRTRMPCSRCRDGDTRCCNSPITDVSLLRAIHLGFYRQNSNTVYTALLMEATHGSTSSTIPRPVATTLQSTATRRHSATCFSTLPVRAFYMCCCYCCCGTLQATIPTTDDGVSSTTSSVKQEPQSELAAQNTAECRPRKGRVALDASCGRRTARTALGSMDVESFGPDDERGCTEYIEQKQQGTHTNGGEVRSSRRRRGDKRRSRAPAGNLETADKMQGATRAEDYTAPGLQRWDTRNARRGSMRAL